MLLIDPRCTVGEALALLEQELKPGFCTGPSSLRDTPPSLLNAQGVIWPEHASSQFVMDQPMRQRIDPNSVELKGFWCVRASDLLTMRRMGLNQIPVEAIGLPLDSMVLGFKNAPLTPTGKAAPAAQLYDEKPQLTRHFPGFLVAALVEMQSLLNRMGVKGYVIGGLPRDLMLANTAYGKNRDLDLGYRQDRRKGLEDVDITLEADAIDCMPFFLKHSRNFTENELFPEFGTAKLCYKHQLVFDLASTRRERYPACAALPDVLERGVPLAVDISRRDFTMNTLALSLNELGQILDYTQSLPDLEARRLQVLHPLSFFEDPSRILRAVKFASRLDFTMTTETRTLMAQFLRHGGAVYHGGGERIKTELDDWLSQEETPLKSTTLLQFLEEGGLRLLNMSLPSHPWQAWAASETDVNPTPSVWLAAAHKQLPLLSEALRDGEGPMPEEGEAATVASSGLSKAGAGESHDRFNERRGLTPQVYHILILRMLPPDLQEETMHRLGLVRAERQALEQARKLLKSETLLKISAKTPIPDLMRMLRGVRLPALIASLIVLSIENYARYELLLAASRAYRKNWSRVKIALKGADLLGLGVPAGKTVGSILEQLLFAHLQGQVRDRADEIRWVENWLKQHPE